MSDERQMQRPKTEAEPVEAQAGNSPPQSMFGAAEAAMGSALVQRKLARRLVQRRGGGAEDSSTVHAAAQQGLQGGSQALPHLDKIQASFGRHDVGGIEAHVGGPATAASERMGASAYAVGNSVAFAASPDLHTTAHEAAHVVQQRGGVQLKGGVGEAGDTYEQNADAVADAVVAGRSAESLLDPHRSAAAPAVVQRKVSEGWKGADSWDAGRTEVDSEGHAARDGKAVPNAQGADEKVGADAVTRVVLNGLQHAKSGRAIVVVPSAAVLKAATSLDVLLHFHGGSNNKGVESNNTEMDNTAKVGKNQSLDKERTHDLNLAKVPQQLAASGGNVLAITIERTTDDRADATDGLVDEVFEYLRTQGLLQKTHTRGRTIVSGYSLGAKNAIDEAKEHEPAQGKKPGSGASQETVQGLFLFDPVGPAIAPTVALINRRLDNDLFQLTALDKPVDQSVDQSKPVDPSVAQPKPVDPSVAQLKYLRTDGYLVRIFGQEPVFNVNAKNLQGKIDQWFTDHTKAVPTDAGVMAQWRSNYQAISVPRSKGRDGWETHGSMEGDAHASPIFDRNYTPGDGNLEKALNAWRDQHKP